MQDICLFMAYIKVNIIKQFKLCLSLSYFWLEYTLMIHTVKLWAKAPTWPLRTLSSTAQRETWEGTTPSGLWLSEEDADSSLLWCQSCKGSLWVGAKTNGCGFSAYIHIPLIFSQLSPNCHLLQAQQPVQGIKGTSESEIG